MSPSAIDIAMRTLSATIMWLARASNTRLYVQSCVKVYFRISVPGPFHQVPEKQEPKVGLAHRARVLAHMATAPSTCVQMTPCRTLLDC